MDHKTTCPWTPDIKGTKRTCISCGCNTFQDLESLSYICPDCKKDRMNLPLSYNYPNEREE